MKNIRISEWRNELTLKYEYKNENTAPVKIYKLSKEELEKYLSKYN